jgi:hypothetical protein
MVPATSESGDFDAGAAEIAERNAHNGMILRVPCEFRKSPLVTCYHKRVGGIAGLAAEERYQ